MPLREYETYLFKKYFSEYFQKKIQSFHPKNKNIKTLQRDLLPKFYRKNSIKNIFSKGNFDFQMQGNIQLKAGILYQSTQNPQIPVENQTNFNMDFDQQISTGINAHFGEILEFKANYDTQSSFNFQNVFQINFNPNKKWMDKDAVLQDVNLGNINMITNNNLMQGARDLFGIKTKLRFGNTNITGVLARKNSQTKTIIAKPDGTLTHFNLKASDYDSERHFFVAHFFRNHYNEFMKNRPLIRSNIKITRLEIWITNTTQNVKNTRNIIALADLGANENHYPKNENNTLKNIFKNPDIRSQKNFKKALPAYFKTQKDYVFLNNARKLRSSEFSFNENLGIVSLRQKLPENAALAVSFAYLVLDKNKMYHVGEFGTDIKNSSENVIVKLLRTPFVDTKNKIWDLMLKNVYAIGSGLKPEKFRLEILHKNEKTGIAINTFKNHTFLNLMGWDVLNQNGFPQKKGDGHFDYLENITIYPKNGFLFFPVLAPFGKDLEQKIGSDTKYIFKEIYTKTQNDIKNNFQNKDRYFLKGYYQSDFKEGISLGVANPKKGSVKVRSGGIALKEGIDFLVDYAAGFVKIVNPSIIALGNAVEISLENTDIFQGNSKIFMGMDVTHHFSEKFLVSGTFLNLSERSSEGKVSLENIPINNKMYGLSFQYNDTFNFITDWVNRLPFTYSKKPTTLNIRGDFAYLKPDVNADTETQGTSTIYIDDFEDAKTNFDLGNFRAWQLSSKPLNFRDEKGHLYDFGSEKNNDLDYGKNRAKLAWYSIDRLFYENTSLKPNHIKKKDISRAEISPVFYKELFPNKAIENTQNPLINTFDLAYYPKERGAYNYDQNLDKERFLKNPEKRWAGITSVLPITNFQKNNITYIEFWLQDPYENYSINQQEGAENKKPIASGNLFFNLGNISEDILKDGEKQYENGLSENPDFSENKSVWGKLPSEPKNVYAFENNENQRVFQDVGLDGLNDVGEKTFFPYFKNFEDPSADNYRFFRSRFYDEKKASVLERYKNYNNPQGNSAIGNLDPENYPTMATAFPDVEDLNKNQTMNTLNGYFQYKISLLKTNWHIGKNYIVDLKKTNRKNPDGSTQKITWYQFRIPLEHGKIIGEKPNWNFMNFIRIFLTGCKTPLVLRFAKLTLVKSNWQMYPKKLNDAKILENDYLTPSEKQKIEIGTVNIEENENKKPIPYVLPPNIQRERIFQNNSVQPQNEQSLSLKIKDLGFGKTLAVYKNTHLDLRIYEKLKMFIHAESLSKEMKTFKNGDITAIIRMGSDLTNHFYQIEIPLKISDFSAKNPEEIWKNELAIFLEDLVNLKIKRSEEKAPNPKIYNHKNKKISIQGFPSLSNIKIIALGIRNTNHRKMPSSAEVWFNELRVEGFKNKGGGGGELRANINISDVANVDFNTQIQMDGFGGIEKNITQRNQFSKKQYALETHLNIEKLLPKKWQLKVPMNYHISEVFKNPIYDYQFQDLLFEKAKKLNPHHENSLEYTLRKSLHFINIGKKPQLNPKFYHLENLTFSYSYNEFLHKNYETQREIEKTVSSSLHYNYAFLQKPIRPFSKFDFLEHNAFFRWIKSFHFNVKPSNISVNARIHRHFYEQKYRNLMEGFSELPALQTRNFKFYWDYTLGYRISKGLNILLKAQNHRVFDSFENEAFKKKKPNFFDNFFERGRMKNYTQHFRMTYHLPFSKLPFLNFMNVNYSYEADFHWQAGNPHWFSNTGNTLKNSHTKKWNATFNLQRLYFHLKIRKNFLYDFLTMFKNIRFHFLEHQSTEIQGFKGNIHFLGVDKKYLGNTPYLKFTFGNQRNLKNEMLKNNDFTYRNIRKINGQNDFFTNKNYTQNSHQKIEFDTNIRPFKNFNIILSAHKIHTIYNAQNLDAVLDHQNQENTKKYKLYFRDTPVIQKGSFSMSYNMLGSFFKDSDANFRSFLDLRKKIGKEKSFAINDAEVLILAMKNAYGNSDGSIFSKIPKLNWQFVYSGFTNFRWVREYFSNIVLSHRYSSFYGVPNYENNLFSMGNAPKNRFSNVYLNENFMPFLKLTVGFKNNITFTAQMDSQRRLEMNLDNYILSDTQQKSYIFGLGYYLKNVKMPFRMGKSNKKIKGDLNIKWDVSYRNDLTLIRNIPSENTEITGGQSVFSMRFLASYNLNKSLNASVYYNHFGNEYAISASFPNTSIEGGIKIIYRLEN